MSPVVLDQSSTEGASGCPHTPPTNHDTAKDIETQLFTELHQPSPQVSTGSEQNHLSQPPFSHSHSLLRPNGSHHNAFSCNPALSSPAGVKTKLNLHSDPSSKSSVQLLEQTGSLISEFYSHSRLHQISTWRIGFSEYINELHHKKKESGSISYPGKDRLRKAAAQRPSDSRGSSALSSPPAGTLVLQIPNQPNTPGIVLELPNFSQVDPDVFAALPKELQEELKSAYNRAANVQAQLKTVEQKNPLLQLKQPAVGTGIGRVKRRYKRKNAVSPLKKGTSPMKRQQTNSPVKPIAAAGKSREPINIPKNENNPSTSNLDLAEPAVEAVSSPVPMLAGAFDLTDIRTLLREWVTTITEPMEEDILQVVKYCTELIEDKDLEKLDLIIKYMKRLMQQSVESVWSMAFDFILDNVQVILQQAYGSILKIT